MLFMQNPVRNIAIILALCAVIYFLSDYMVVSPGNEASIPEPAVTVPAAESSGLPAPPMPEERPFSDIAADLAWTATRLDGTPFDSATLKGKVVFLNFWATWCGPCVREIPSIQELTLKVVHPDMVFLCVANEESGTVNTFIKNQGFRIPIVLLEGGNPAVYSHTGIPTTYLIARDGMIVFSHTGTAAWDDPSVVRFLELLLKEKP